MGGALRAFAACYHIFSHLVLADSRSCSPLVAGRVWRGVRHCRVARVAQGSASDGVGPGPYPSQGSIGLGKLEIVELCCSGQID